MFKLIKKIFLYVVSFGNYKFDEHADAKVQIQQVIEETKGRHRELKERAAVVLGNASTVEMRLATKVKELAEANSNAQNAVKMASAEPEGTPKQLGFLDAAEAFAEQAIALESEVTDLKSQYEQAHSAAENAKEAVSQNARLLQQKMAQGRKLMSEVDQAKMADAMVDAMAMIDETMGGALPTFSEIEEKVHGKLGLAKGRAELQSDSVEFKMAQVQAQTFKSGAKERVAQLMAASKGELPEGTPVAEPVQVTAPEKTQVAGS